jgi:hypothetical protein
MSFRRSLLLAKKSKPNLFVALQGNEAFVRYSLNGTAWQASSSVGWGTYCFDAVTNGSLTMVSVYDGTTGRYRYYSTTNFASWARAGTLESVYPGCVCYDGSLFVITQSPTSSRGEIYTTPNGTDLTLRRSVDEETFTTSMIGKNGVISALRRDGSTSYQSVYSLASPYTGGWTIKWVANFSSYNPSHLHRVGNGVMVFGRGGGHSGYLYSGNLISWAGVQYPFSGASDVGFYLNGIYKSIDTSYGRVLGLPFTSEQEIVYSTASTPSGKTSAVSAVGQVLVATSSGVIRSTNGVNFTTVLPGSTRKIVAASDTW